MANSQYALLRALFALTIVVMGATPQATFASEVDSIVVADGFYEYAKDGASTLGFISSPVKDGKVKFTTCNLNTVEVVRTDLRPSKAKCEHRSPGKGIWYTNAEPLGPAYAAQNDATGTKVVFQGKVIDVTTLRGWSPEVMPIRRAVQSEPVGFVYKDPMGTKALVILRKSQSGTPEKP